MKVELVVIDTNVLISYALKPDGLAGRVADFFIENSRLLFCQETFTELETRLWRPKFDRYITLEQRKQVLHDVGMSAVWVEITGKPSYSRDPDDDKFVETALLGQADLLVSGDSDLLDLESVDGLPILSPRACWEQFQH
ncbi:putative toxin-antitoxin system toxin component, PIN family [Thiothrix winogradskyi]|uniref:Toxin-antitoxin system toxin component, PIN family n=1 Tax=Thiothrix winogradskyi TaxID=96472 RepID=A0ABY3SSZ2_9GAMM|nr:putative toxin-antitoxin system toxin component, PIN family [Thiothrix winogradskyi]UJS22555.1 putative toxin-antitoxin system toxin component, PIN family [Thiothrix winogradskyi]